MKIDVDTFVKGLNFDGFQEKSVEMLKSSVGSVDEKTKTEVREWIKNARRIKNDENVPRRARMNLLRELETSDVVVSFIKSLVLKMIGNFPVGTQTVAKFGLTGAAMAFSFVSLKRVAIVLYMIRLGLPKFIMSNKFEEFAEFVEDAFSQIQRRIHCNSNS